MAATSIRFTAVLACAAMLAACASGPRNPSTWQGARLHFAEMDKNDDRVLMRDELNPELALYQEFDRYDVDGNDRIEEDEFNSYINSRSD